MSHDDDVMKCLEGVANHSHYGNREVFNDFTRVVELTLHQMPAHLVSIQEGNGLCSDPPDIIKVFEEITSKYGKTGYDSFAKAFAILIHSTQEYQDVLGNVFMKFVNPHGANNSQFFTPWNVALMMAQMNGISDTFLQRFKEATLKSPIAQALVIAWSAMRDGFSEDELMTFVVDKLLPEVIPHFGDPITVCDPCVGSGVMLLAAASQVPAWANLAGLVQYYGFDIDPLCVRMATINCMLYGLNNHYAKSVDSLNDVELNSLQEPYKTMYTECQSNPQMMLFSTRENGQLILCQEQPAYEQDGR